MNTISSLMNKLTEDLGYNPYESFRSKDGIISFRDAIINDYFKIVYESIVYQAARTIRQMHINRFFEFVTPCAFDDLYVVGLMIEIYRRTHNVSSVNRFYFSDTQYVEFTDWQDLVSALEQLKPHYPELQAYKGIESSVPQAYQNMSDQHLLNAWFQRVLNEVTGNEKVYAFCDINKLVFESAELDGLIGFTRLIGPVE
ncbi:MAG: hypothetical protein EKK57_07925 [Proteobacteria bacterium]|nr:MAG: hypothetical protein EKK57_07925 [Pseudomonadota bacterium]